ncbi:MAG TPA: hypothetical protein VIH93_03195 [Thermoanaerobaculia bacterium]
MLDIRRHFDPWSLLIIAITLALFLAALVLKGLTHDLLLEAGVFLVSVKLILMSYKNGVRTEHLDARLARIESALERLAGRAES